MNNDAQTVDTTEQPTDAQPAAEAVNTELNAEIAALQAKLAETEAQVSEFKDQWLRAAADYKNFKRRTEMERSELVRSAGADILLKLLPVMDDFDRAIDNIPAEIAESSWWGGTQLIAHKLRILLESQGVKAIEAVGTDFDPNIHEAVLYEDAPGQDGKVVEELQKGYRLHDRVLRPSMVKVGRD